MAEMVTYYEPLKKSDRKYRPLLVSKCQLGELPHLFTEAINSLQIFKKMNKYQKQYNKIKRFL